MSGAPGWFSYDDLLQASVVFARITELERRVEAREWTNKIRSGVNEERLERANEMADARAEFYAETNETTLTPAPEDAAEKPTVAQDDWRNRPATPTDSIVNSLRGLGMEEAADRIIALTDECRKNRTWAIAEAEDCDRLRAECERLRTAPAIPREPTEAALRRIVDTYDAYRARGVTPAPTEYADFVRAIVDGKAALAAAPEGKAIPREPTEAIALLCKARSWMNEAVGASWKVHDMVNPVLFDAIDACCEVDRHWLR